MKIQSMQTQPNDELLLSLPNVQARAGDCAKCGHPIESHPTAWDAETFGTLVCDGKRVFEPTDRSRTFRTRRKNAYGKRAHLAPASWMKLAAALMTLMHLRDS